MSHISRYDYGYVDDGNGGRFLGLIARPTGKLVLATDYDATEAARVKAEAECEELRAALVKVSRDADQLRAELAALKAQQAEHKPVAEFEPDSVCEDPDGCPTELAVLKRFWRDHRDRQLSGPVIEAMKWAEHLLFECGALTSTRAPSVHVYNKTFEAVNAAKALLTAPQSAPAQDVAGLVEALRKLDELPKQSGHAIPTAGRMRAEGLVIRAARELVAAHEKQSGGEA